MSKNIIWNCILTEILGTIKKRKDLTFQPLTFSPFHFLTFSLFHPFTFQLSIIMNTPSTGPIIKDDEIDLLALVKTIWAGRRIIAYTTAVVVLLGLISAFTSPVKYSASATLLPSAEKKLGGMGNLSGLAGMAGINIGSMMGESSGIPAELYPQVLGSYPFLNQLIHQEFHFEKFAQPRSFFDYQMGDTLLSVGGVIAKYTIRLPWTIKNAIVSSPDRQQKKPDFGVLKQTEEEEEIFKEAARLLSATVDKKSGLVTVTATASEPVLTAQIVQKAVELLQTMVIDYKTQQTRQNLDFVQQRYDEHKKVYEEAQQAFFDFKDRHRNLISERVDLEYQRLSDAYDIASTVFKGLAQQLEQARIAVKEETPVFSVLEPVTVPNEKSAPKRGIILVGSVFLGLIFGIGAVFAKLFWNSIKKQDDI